MKPILLTKFQKRKKNNYPVSPKSVQSEPSCCIRTGGRTDGRKDKYAEPDSRFS
jgi:hypothetical protein